MIVCCGSILLMLIIGLNSFLLGMVMCDNEFEQRKIKFKPRIN